MGEIINKNIFKDSDLHKLSPDYDPSFIFTRMQVRRSMVKDEHSHGIYKTSNSHRKPIRKIRENKLNKEIIKMKNELHNLNLENQLMLKKSKNFGNCKLKLVEKVIQDNALWDEKTSDFSFRESFENANNLSLHNNTTFKIIDRPSKCETDNKILEKESFEKLEPYQGMNDDTLLRIKLTEKLLDSKTCRETVNENQMQDTDTKKGTEISPIAVGFDNDVSDLQKLLVMMAITTKSNENENYGDQSALVGKNVIAETEKHENVTKIEGDYKSDILKVLNIAALRIRISSRQKFLLSKYVSKWKNYILKKKEQKKLQREETLRNFVRKLETRKVSHQTKENTTKAKLSVRDYSTYQHRYKVQKHIIALQKVKIEEQNRLIEELKYNKIIEASQQSLGSMKEEINKTYYEIDRQLKPKIKCLTNELKIHQIEEPALVLHCLKVPQFLQRMEKRAREREEKHAMIRERRRQMEDERIRLKEQAELAKAEMDKEEKIKRIKELKEKRRKEKVENIRKKQHAEKIRALIVIADLHYEKHLMTKYGINPLKKLIEIKKKNEEKADLHHKFQLKKNLFLRWMWYTEDMWFERNYVAEDFYRKKILRKVFEALKMNLQEYNLKKQVAEDYYDLYVTHLMFRKLKEAVAIIRRDNEMKWNKAVIYYNSGLLFKTFTCWRSLPALNALQREQEARKARWRTKVLQVVPDYVPPDD